MKKDRTELVFILDKSGSMSGLEKDTIGGYNSLLAKQKELEGECRITTVLFDNNYVLLHDRIDLKAVSEITDKEYNVGGTTALLDAIGKTINKIDNAQKHTADEYRADKVMFVVITDGEENSSREYPVEKVKGLIETMKKERSWEFVFLGANIDAVQTAASFGISADNAVTYLSDRRGTKLSYSVMAKAVSKFRTTGAVDRQCFNEIREDTQSRG